MQSSCGLWAQTKMEAQKRRKRWASNLMKCNKCSIACTRKVQLLLHLQSQHIEHQKNINDLSKKSHKTFCQYFADEQIDGLKLLHGNYVSIVKSRSQGWFKLYCFPCRGTLNAYAQCFSSELNDSDFCWWILLLEYFTICGPYNMALFPSIRTEYLQYQWHKWMIDFF